jgi:hypothetical protein
VSRSNTYRVEPERRFLDGVISLGVGAEDPIGHGPQTGTGGLEPLVPAGQSHGPVEVGDEMASERRATPGLEPGGGGTAIGPRRSRVG